MGYFFRGQIYSGTPSLHFPFPHTNPDTIDTICRTFVELNFGSTHGTCRLNQMSHQCRSKVELIHLGPVRHMKSTGV